MPGPLHFPRVLVLYPFRYRHELTGKWVKGRYRAERHVIADRYAEWEIIGPPEIRRSGAGQPVASCGARTVNQAVPEC